jgi:hypothetical protein
MDAKGASSKNKGHCMQMIDEKWVVFSLLNVPESTQTADSLLRILQAMYSNAGSPSNVWVYRRKNRAGDHEYFVSPAGITLYQEVISRFEAKQVEHPFPSWNLTLLIPNTPPKGGANFVLHWQPA